MIWRLWLAFAVVACNDKPPAEVKTAPVPPAQVSCPDERACFELGRVRKAVGDLVGAYAAYRRGCDDLPGGGEDCLAAALLAYGDDRVATAIAPDPVAGQRYYEKACDRGFADGCANAGVHYLATRDFSRVQEFLVKSCTMNSGLGCYNLGVAVRDGEGVAADHARAASLFEQSCTYQYAGGCHNLGLAYMSGDGVVLDRQRAVQLLEQACTLAPQHCFDIALAYERGDGVAKDLERARKRYDMGCTAGNLKACSNLANFMADGLGGPSDLAGAAKLEARACNGGVQESCENLRMNDGSISR